MVDKKIHCFGDSWTHGIGSELVPGSGVHDIKDKYDTNKNAIRKLYSWPGRLRGLIPHEVINNGVAGSSNKEIYKSILTELNNGNIKSGDIVIVMWSSIVREPLNFFITPYDDNVGFVHYNDAIFLREDGHHGNEIPHWVHNLTENFENTFNRVTYEVYKEFLLNRLNYNFLHEIFMNYVCNLQIYFEEMDIDYLFINAFESTLNKDNKLYSYVNLNKWLSPDSCMDQFLKSKIDEIDKNLPYSYWEDDFKLTKDEPAGPHPNRIGYQLIADEIIKFMKENKYEI